MSKSFTTIEQHMCAVTGKPFDSGALLINTRMEDVFEMKTVTNWGISPDVQKMFDDGFSALVVIDEEKTDFPSDGNPKPEDVYRTGEIVYLKTALTKKILGREIKTFCWIDKRTAEYLKSITPKS